MQYVSYPSFLVGFLVLIYAHETVLSVRISPFHSSRMCTWFLLIYPHPYVLATVWSGSVVIASPLYSKMRENTHDFIPFIQPRLTFQHNRVLELELDSPGPVMVDDWDPQSIWHFSGQTMTMSSSLVCTIPIDLRWDWHFGTCIFFAGPIVHICCLVRWRMDLFATSMQRASFYQKLRKNVSLSNFWYAKG